MLFFEHLYYYYYYYFTIIILLLKSLTSTDDKRDNFDFDILVILRWRNSSGYIL